MSTEQGEPDSGLAAELFKSRTITSLDQSAAALEAAYQSEQDKRREERFFWICVVAFFADFALFRDIHWTLGLALFLFELAVLLAMAKWLGLEHVAVPLER